MNVNDSMKKLFEAIDQKDAEEFSSFLSDNVNFRFGNAPEIQGREEVKKTIDGFFNSIHSINHEIEHILEMEDVVVSNGTVNYTRLDQSKLTVPFANVFKMDGKLIGEYQIYVDISDLYR